MREPIAPNRYVVINAEKPIRLDRWTGKTWVKEPFAQAWTELKSPR